MGVGRPRQVSDEELLRVIRESAGPAVTAREVANEVTLSRRCVHSRLTDLTEEGVLETKGEDERARMWWLA